MAAKSRVVTTRKVTPRNAAARKETRKATVTAARRATPAQGDAGPSTTGSMREANETKPSGQTAVASAPAPANTTVIPAQSLFGNWTLVEDSGNRKCRLILGGVPIGAAYSARGEAGCPQAFSDVHTWEIRGHEVVLRNPARAIVGRLQPTGPSRFDGQSGSGTSVYLMR